MATNAITRRTLDDACNRLAKGLKNPFAVERFISEHYRKEHPGWAQAMKGARK